MVKFCPGARAHALAEPPRGSKKPTTSHEAPDRTRLKRSACEATPGLPREKEFAPRRRGRQGACSGARSVGEPEPGTRRPIAPDTQTPRRAPHSCRAAVTHPRTQGVSPEQEKGRPRRSGPEDDLASPNARSEANEGGSIATFLLLCSTPGRCVRPVVTQRPLAHTDVAGDGDLVPTARSALADLGDARRLVPAVPA